MVGAAATGYFPLDPGRGVRVCLSSADMLISYITRISQMRISGRFPTTQRNWRGSFRTPVWPGWVIIGSAIELVPTDGPCGWPPNRSASGMVSESGSRQRNGRGAPDGHRSMHGAHAWPLHARPGPMQRPSAPFTAGVVAITNTPPLQWACPDHEGPIILRASVTPRTAA